MLNSVRGGSSNQEGGCIVVKRSVLVVLTLLLTLALSAAAFADHGTIISNQLTATIEAAEQQPTPDKLELTWVTQPPETVKVGEPFTVAVQLQNNTEQDFASALVIVEVRKDDQPATPDDFTATADGVALGYNSDGGYFFWGPSKGFPIPRDYD